MNDSLERNAYTNHFADNALMIQAAMTNTVLNIINVNKTSEKIKPEQGQNQQILNKILLDRKDNHYSAIAANRVRLRNASSE